MENSSVASASSEAGSTRSQEIEELERFIDSYVLEYQVQGLLGDKADGDLDVDNGGKAPEVRALLHERVTRSHKSRICWQQGSFLQGSYGHGKPGKVMEF